jgi:hypothetical protein
LKKIVWLGAVLFCMAACENKAKVESKTDSLKQTLSTTFEKTTDSAKAKGERTLEAIKEKVRDIKTDTDSVKKDSVQSVNQ